MARYCLIYFAILLAQIALAAAPATQPAEPDWHVSAPIEKHVKAIDAFICGSIETTFKEMKAAVPKLIDPLVDRRASLFTGCCILVYHGITDDMAKPFTLDAGFPTRVGTKDQDGFKVKALPAFHCMTVYYTGPIEHISEAYMLVYPALFQRGLRPTGEVREVNYHWEDAASPNNVIEVQVGVADQ